MTIHPRKPTWAGCPLDQEDKLDNHPARSVQNSRARTTAPQARGRVKISLGVSQGPVPGTDEGNPRVPT